MQLKLSNINKIEEATINMSGLTVIAGVNDTGKSTIGKILFTLIKAINKTSSHSEGTKYPQYRLQVSRFYTLLKETEKQYSENIIGGLFPASSKEFLDNIMGTIGESELENAFYMIDSLSIAPQQKARLLRCIQNMKEIMAESSEPIPVFTKELQDSIEAEFLNNVCSNGTDYSTIEFSENTKTKKISVYIRNNKIEVTSGEGLEKFSIEDITFVESPLYIHLIDTLCNARTLKEQRKYGKLLLTPFVNYHVKDLAQKLYAIRYLPQSSFSDNLVSSEKIDEITKGKFVFDDKTQSIYWQKDGINYSPVNVASGLKSFGVMQILSETQAINENRILVWDEPENHLHPEWQIKLAELMVKMSKAGIPILVSSHSPYFIQAVRYFAQKCEMEKYVSYYLAEEQENGLSRMDDVTDDLNRLFYKLAQPMNEIINLGM